MKTKHTPEPWKVKEDKMAGLLAWDIDSNSGLITFESLISQEDARRIVACVNACAGISTEELEKIVSDNCNVEDHYRAEQSEADFLDSKDAE